ncbi:MAG: hypothetical protein RL550_1909 [Actinomycetota bacterium]
MTERIVTPRLLAVMGATLAYYVCVGILIPVLPVFVENGMGSGEAMVGASAVAFSLAAVLSRPLITWVGVHSGRRALMLGGALVGALGGFGMVLVTEPWQLMPLRALMGVGEAALFVGASTIVVESTPTHRRAEAASYLSLSVFGGLSVGPIIGEAVLGDVASSARGLTVGNFDGVFALVGLAALIAALVSFAAPHWVGEKITPEPFRWLERDAVFPGFVLACGIASWTAFSTFLPTFAKGQGIQRSAPFFLLYSVICIAVRLFGATWPERWGLRRTVTGAMTTIFAGMVLVSLVGRESGIWMSTALMGLGMSFLYPALLAMSVKNVSDTRRVAVVSSFTMFFEIGATVSGLLLGGVGELLGKRSIFIGGSMFAAMGLVALLSTRRSPSEPVLSVTGG